MTGKEMAAVVNTVRGFKEKKIDYQMIPRFMLKIFIHELSLMANWIESAGYGADLNDLKKLAIEEGVVMTSFEHWLEAKGNI